MRNLIVFMPYNLPFMPLKVFKSFIDVVGADVQDELREKGVRVVPYIYDKFNTLDFAQNDAVERSLHELKAEWIMFMDGDMVFPKRTLPMLLQTISEKHPIVCGMYWRKLFPFHCVPGRYNANRTPYYKTAESLEFVGKDGQQLLSYNSIGKFDPNGVPFEVNVFGKGCMLVHADVFRKLEQPYFKFIDEYQINDHTIRNIGEDMYFYANLYKAGIKGLCDPHVRCGHVAEIVRTQEDFETLANQKVKLEGFIDVTKDQEDKHGTDALTPKKGSSTQRIGHQTGIEDWRRQIKESPLVVESIGTETGAIRGER